MTSSSQSNEARELSLIEKVELRIALADSDQKLQSMLDTYLAPLLLKLASEYVSVRNKVISVCQHLTTRIKPQNIRLPVKSLLTQFKDNHNPLVRHFDLVYIQQGFSRLSSADRADLLASLVPGISASSSPSAKDAAALFNLFLKSLLGFRFPPKGSKSDLALRTDLGLSDKDARSVAFWMGKLLLLKLSSSNSCPGVSTQEYGFLTLHGRPDTWNTSTEFGISLNDAKIVSLRALASGLFVDEDRFFPALYAAADPNSRISDPGEDLFKMSSSSATRLHASMLPKLSDTYFGASVASPNDQSDAQAYVPPVPTPVRIKILHVFSSLAAFIESSEMIKRIVQQDLVGRPPNKDDPNKLDRETLKLRSGVISLLTSVSRQCRTEVLERLSQDVIDVLKQFLDQHYGGDRSAEVTSLRGRSFEVIGLLAGSNPKVLQDQDLLLLRWLFRSLGDEIDRDVVFSIDSALAATVRPLQRDMQRDVEESIRKFLLEVIENEWRNQRNIRYACVRFANRCLAYSDVIARWIDIYALGLQSNQSFELTEEAKRGLDPYWYRMSQDSPIGEAEQSMNNVQSGSRASFPDFQVVVTYFFEEHRTKLTNAAALAAALDYARRALFLQCLTSQDVGIAFDPAWERKLDLAITEDEVTRQSIRKALKNMVQDPAMHEAILTIWRHCVNGLEDDSQSARASILKFVSDLCSVSSDLLMKELCGDCFRLQPAILANNPEIRHRAAKCYGLLTSFLDRDESPRWQTLSQAQLQRLGEWKQAVGAEANKVDGSLIALGYSLSRRLYLYPSNELCQNILKQFVPSVLSIMEADDGTLQAAAFESFGQLCLFGAVTQEAIMEQAPILSITDRICKSARQGNEKAIAALGHFSMLFDEKDDRENLEKFLDEARGLHEIRQPESQLSVGEALVSIGCGWKSKALLSKLDMDSRPQGPSRGEMFSRVVESILQDTRNAKPSLRKVGDRNDPVFNSVTEILI